MSDDAIERRMQELRDTAARYAKANAVREYLDEFKKSKLAILMRKYEGQGFTTAAAQEREARADTEYRDLLINLQSATEEAEKLRWELRIAEAGIAVWQTRSANLRAERKGYGA